MFCIDKKHLCAGNLWTQNWDSLIDILLPEEDSKYNLDNKLKSFNWSVISMVKKAENFYTSLGLPSMTKKFWLHSKFDNSGACHGTAANMFAKDDFRYDLFLNTYLNRILTNICIS